MTRVLKTTLLLAVAMMVFSSLSFGSILCDGAPTTLNAANAGGGCQFGSNLFTNLSLAGSFAFPGTPSDSINSGTVSVSFTGSTTNPGVVNVVLTNSDAASWALTGTQQFSLVFSYTVTGSAAYFGVFGQLQWIRNQQYTGHRVDLV